MVRNSASVGSLSDGYADRPCYAELIAVVAAGMVHVLTEISLSEPTARLYNAAVSLVFIVYLVWRVRRSEGATRAWGMRIDNFWPALRAHSPFAVAGAVALVGYGFAMGTLFLPLTFWMTVALYPIWGVAQQFALQNFIARNLAGIVSPPLAVAGLASVLFGAAHYPRIDLVLLTLVAGVFLTLVYRRFPNLWAVGIIHGILGSLAVYIVLQEDPGAAIVEFVLGR